MRVSPRRHVLVSLREAIGISQKEFAGAVQIGESTLQKIELGTYPLRPRIAERIATYTGVDINYLTRNDFSELLLNWRGEPYDKGDFEAAQGGQKSRTVLKQNHRIWDYKAARLSATATLLAFYHHARCAFLDQPHAWGPFNQFVYRLYRLMEETVEAAEPEKTKASLWKRVREEHDQTTQKQQLLSTKGDTDELLDLLARLEKQNQPKAKDTKPRRVRALPAKQRVSARRSAHAPPRARQVSSSLNNAKK
jgi:transcriptional regulator with XRE-family HTH domain